MSALATAVSSGKALYVGVSSYSAQHTEEAAQILRDMGVRVLIHQPSYSLVNRWIEDELLGVLEREGIGCIAFSPLAQGLLTDKYLRGGSPNASRARFFKDAFVSEENLEHVRALDEVASSRGQSLAQMAVAWVLRDSRVTSALVGASSVEQLEDNVAALERLDFADDELAEIDAHAVDLGVNIWAASSEA
jgi:L-glyceraldehyde 3-phosphate reductase